MLYQPNGNVLKFKGTSENVNFKDVDIEDCIIFHNHPKDINEYSFSNLGIILFNNNVSRLRGADHKYTYEMDRNAYKIKKKCQQLMKR